MVQTVLLSFPHPALVSDASARASGRARERAAPAEHGSGRTPQIARTDFQVGLQAGGQRPDDLGQPPAPQA